MAVQKSDAGLLGQSCVRDAIKVFGTMIVRIVLLMVLIGLGPVAFAMYASPSTEHWTKKWVNLLLGTTFQQVMVLAVLFIGGAMASAATYELSLWREYWQVMFFALASLMVLFVAAKVPDLVNPGAQGLFSGFVQAATMALAAGAMIGGGLAGAGSVIAGRGGGMMSNLGSRIMNMRPGGGGMNAPGEAAQTAGGTMSGVARDAGGAGRVGSSGSSPVAESGNNAGNRDFGLGGGDTPTGGAPSGGSGSGGGGGGGSGGGGFAREVGRGFMGGASRGTRLGRAMMDVQGGRFFLNDPTTAYAPNSQAQMQGLRDYAAGREFGSNPRDMEQAQQQRLNRGGGYGYRPRYDREQGPDHELPEEGLGGDQSGGDQSGGENG